MQTIAYASPWIPPEWIAAHGMRPRWLRLQRDGSTHPLAGVRRGVCPFAGALADAAVAGLDVSALVMTTACDQMRYAAAVVQQRSSLPVFLLNMPSTWQTPAARQMYRDELVRLGGWLRQLGGRLPSRDDLAGVMLQYDFARTRLRASREQFSGRQFAEALADLHGMPTGSGVFSHVAGKTSQSSTGFADNTEHDRRLRPVPLAILGGPLLADELAILDTIEQRGGRVVLDATEGGERTLPAALDRSRIQADPLGELVRVYFDGIADVFQRPNDRLYGWLRDHATVRGFCGIVVWRYVWCDLWQAEVARLKQQSPVPVLALDAADGECATSSRTQGRIESFLEMLR